MDEKGFLVKALTTLLVFSVDDWEVFWFVRESSYYNKCLSSGNIVKLLEKIFRIVVVENRFLL